MDETTNPFSPGAGTPPPELAGRAEILRKADIIFKRSLAGMSTQGLMLVGLRGVGKTVLLSKIGNLAENAGVQIVQIEAPEGKGLAELLAPELRRLLLRMNLGAQVATQSRRALQALRNFVGKLKVSVGDFEVSIAPEPGLADSGDLETDLTALFVAIGEAAKEKGTAIVLLIDEMQYLEDEHLAALFAALHRVAQKQLPIVLIGAGLPQLVGIAGRAKSYAERLFEYPPVGPLTLTDAADAIQSPLRAVQCQLTEDAMQRLFEVTQGYPFFLQAWAYAIWNAAESCPIELSVIDAATHTVLERLDTSFFRVRFDRLTPREKDYLRAMAELGAGPHRSGDVAEQLGREISSLAPLRAGLIKKGMIYSPAHGDTAFTVPLFDQFMHRAIPDWKAAPSRPKG
ncbi:MAG: ATP-binding protein [Casimicrobium sp.]